MPAVSRTLAAAVLLTCFLFGMLLAMTGVGRPPARSTFPPHDEPNQLRGVNGVDLRSEDADEKPLRPVGAPNPARVKLDQVESMVWPEQQAESRGFWGPDDEELAQLQGDTLIWPEHKREAIKLWGPNDQEREQVAQILKSGKWQELMVLDDDESDLSFSFAF